MELKDQIICCGIIVGNVLTAAALFGTVYFNYKGRRNTLREHIYKEQFTFYMKFCSEIVTLNSLIIEFDLLMQKKNRSSEDNDAFDRLLNEINNLFDSIYKLLIIHTPVCSTRIDDAMYKSMDDTRSYLKGIVENPSIDYRQELRSIDEGYKTVVNLIRQELRITEFAQENFSLFNFRLNLKKPDSN